MRATGQERRGRGRKTVPGTEAHLTLTELEELPEGTALAFEVAPGVVLTFERAGKGWRVASVPRVRRREVQQ